MKIVLVSVNVFSIVENIYIVYLLRIILQRNYKI